MIINNKIIDFNTAVYIIAEIGINHGGDILKALQMVQEAKESGCDAVKLQVVDPEVSYNKDTLSYEVFRGTKLTFYELQEMKQLCRNLKIDFLSTVGDSSSLALMERVGIDGYKISSGLMTNYPLIEKIISTKKAVIFSTGMSEEVEIKELIQFIKNLNFTNYAILHCISKYPSPANIINIRYMNKLKKYTNEIIGYSDHYLGDTAVLAAVSLGAKVIEKHFSFNKILDGADHSISANFIDMKLMNEKIREIERMLVGPKVKELCEHEAKNINMFRRKLIINKDLKKGDNISLDDLDARRFNNSESGVSPKNYKNFIAKVLNKNLKKFNLIEFHDIIKEV